MRSGNADLLCGTGFVAISAAYGLQLEGLEGISRAFPLALILMLLAGGLYFIGAGWWKRRGDPPPATEKTAWKKISAVSLASAAYAALIPALGFFCATALFIFFSCMLLCDRAAGARRVAVVGALFALSFSILVWLGFTKLLDVPAPTGLFF